MKQFHPSFLRFLTVTLLASLGVIARADPPVLHDPARPVLELGRDGFVLQYYTSAPTQARVQVRQAVHGEVVRRGLLGESDHDGWAEPDVRTVHGESGPRTYHRVRVDGLEPGRRYFYRVWAGQEEPTSTEKLWGARDGWRREYAVATLAPQGQRTVIRYPVKVLLMPNVVNVASATPLAEGEQQPADVTYQRPTRAVSDIPPPRRFDTAAMQRLREELRDASRFFWVNSGMRYWVDFELVVDDRLQRWGDEPAGAPRPLRDLPLARSYGGVDYHQPGGGVHTLFNLREARTVLAEPIPDAAGPFPGQIEITAVQRYNANTNQWEYYNSGGGTYGVDELWKGMPGRSQYLGGGDIAWLTTHEFHHQMESLGAYSLANREDERIVYNHYYPRGRDRGPNAASTPDGEAMRWPWSSSDRHGEHYDGMAFWDRSLSDVQWLRLIAGEAVVVEDRDNDGVPDDDPRLPLDEKRFGSDPRKAMTDGVMNDLDKIMLSTWAPAPLQATALKPRQRFTRPQPAHADSDADGLADAVDSAPLVGFEPFVWPGQAKVDGTPDEWKHVPMTGRLDAEDLAFTYQQMYDDAAYYGLMRLRGDWSRVRALFDGEGKGAFGGGTMSFNVYAGDPVTVKSGYHGTRGFTSATRVVNGETIVEFRMDNWAEGGWFWQGADREVGLVFEVYNAEQGIYSVYEPYRFFYTRMLESAGQKQPLDPPPAMLAARDADAVLQPGDPRLHVSGWERDGRVYRHVGGNDAAIEVRDLQAGNFDLCVRIEGKNDFILAAFTEGQDGVGVMHDYVSFVGGYANTRTRLRLFGYETGDSSAAVTPGVHTVQLSRRDGNVWLLMDGKLLVWAADPNRRKAVTRLVVIGGFGGEQVVHEIRYRIDPPAAPQAGKE